MPVPLTSPHIRSVFLPYPLPPSYLLALPHLRRRHITHLTLKRLKSVNQDSNHPNVFPQVLGPCFQPLNYLLNPLFPPEILNSIPQIGKYQNPFHPLLIQHPHRLLLLSTLSRLFFPFFLAPEKGRRATILPSLLLLPFHLLELRLSYAEHHHHLFDHSSLQLKHSHTG